MPQEWSLKNDLRARAFSFCPRRNHLAQVSRNGDYRKYAALVFNYLHTTSIFCVSTRFRFKRWTLDLKEYSPSLSRSTKTQQAFTNIMSTTSYRKRKIQLSDKLQFQKIVSPMQNRSPEVNRKN